MAIFDLALEASGTPADGFSFNFGPIPDDGGPAGAAEEGWGQGLAIEFDTWNNDGEGADNGIGVDVLDGRLPAGRNHHEDGICPQKAEGSSV